MLRAVLRSKKGRETISAALAHLILIVGAVVITSPLAWMISTSLKTPDQVWMYPPRWIPNPVDWGNFKEALTVLPFHLFLKNTAYITSLGLIGQLLSASIVAFAFARLRWVGRDVLFMVVLATMMLPHQVTLVPQFIIFRELEWINTHYPLIVPSFFGGGAFSIFLLRQFFMTLSLEMDDAARIDGCGPWGIYWRIILPLSRPALAAVAIFGFRERWNAFLMPLIYLHSQEKFTLELGLQAFQGMYSVDWELVMAASLVVMLPVLGVFFFAQKYFIQGVVFTGVKG